MGDGFGVGEGVGVGVVRGAALIGVTTKADIAHATTHPITTWLVRVLIFTVNLVSGGIIGHDYVDPLAASKLLIASRVAASAATYRSRMLCINVGSQI